MTCLHRASKCAAYSGNRVMRSLKLVSPPPCQPTKAEIDGEDPLNPPSLPEGVVWHDIAREVCIPSNGKYKFHENGMRNLSSFMPEI